MNDESAEPSSSATSAPHHHAPPTPSQLAARRKKNRENFNRRRGDLLDELLRSLDILIYAELSAVYYMDCWTSLLLLRGLLQLFYLTPKHALLPDPPAGSRFVIMILASNALCILLHSFRTLPEARDAQDRGFLHGGLVLDFIGQRGPASRWQLVGLDLLVLGLQIVHVAAFSARKGLRDKVWTAVPLPAGFSAGQGAEDEERGVRRSEEVGRGQDVEMVRLNPAGRTVTESAGHAGTETDSAEHDALLDATTQALERTDAHIFDAFNSGQIVLADLDLQKTLREECWTSAKSWPMDDSPVAEQNRAARQRLIERMRGRVGLGRFGGPAAAPGGEV